MNQPPTPLKAVVFDLDGLIANTEDIYELVGQELLRRRGKDYTPELREQMMGRPVLDALQVMLEWYGLTDSLEDLSIESRGLVYQYMQTELAPMPGFMKLLDDLEAAGFPMAVATSGRRDYADRIFAQLELDDRFQFTLTSEDTERGKPAPDVYQLAAKRFRSRPEEMLVLEDSANGCRAAVAAGAYTVAVPNRHTGTHDFVGVAFVADSLADPRIRRVLQLAE